MAEKLSGFYKYFNSSTINGRANVGKATYGAIAVSYILYRLTRKKKTPPPPPSADGAHPNAENPECGCGCCEQESSNASSHPAPVRSSLPHEFCEGHECGETVSNTQPGLDSPKLMNDKQKIDDEELENEKPLSAVSI